MEAHKPVEENPHMNSTGSTAPIATNDSFLKRYRIPAFFVLAYAISWSALSIIIFGVGGDALSTPAFLIAQFGPAIAGVIMVYASGESLRELASRITKWRVPVKWYLIIFALPAAVFLTATIWQVLLGFPVDYSIIVERLPGYIPSVIIISLIAGLGEEPGWRGFALPHLQNKLSPLKATAILGVLWAAWHFPLLFVDQDFMNMGLTGAVLVGTILLTMLLIASLAFFYTWIYNRTGSVLTMILLHGSINTAQVYLLPLSFDASHDARYPVLLLSITLTIVAYVLVLIYATKGRLGYGSAN